MDAANDGIVPPTILPGSKKLGEERSQVSADVLAAEGFLMDDYRSRKLMDYYLEPIALKNDLTLDEVRLLMYLTQPHHSSSRKELADFANLSLRSLSVLLQKLSSKNYLKVENKRSSKQLQIVFLPLATPVLAEISTAQGNYDRARFAGFTEDDLIQYAYFTEKIKHNMQKIL